MGLFGRKKEVQQEEQVDRRTLKDARKEKKLSSARQDAEEARSRAEQARKQAIESQEKRKQSERQARMSDRTARTEEQMHQLEEEARLRRLREAQRKEKEAQRKEKAVERQEKAAARRERARYRRENPRFYNPNLRLHSVLAVILAVLAVFIALSLLLRESAGVIGDGIAYALLGCFSYMAYLIPLFMLLHAATWRGDIQRRTLAPKALAFLPVLLLSAAVAAVYSMAGFSSGTYAGWEAFLAGQTPIGGGAVGYALGYVLYNGIGEVGLWLLFSLALLFFGVLWCSTPIRVLYLRTRLRFREARVRAAQRRADPLAAEAEDAAHATRQKKRGTPSPAPAEEAATPLPPATGRRLRAPAAGGTALLADARALLEEDVTWEEGPHQTAAAPAPQGAPTREADAEAPGTPATAATGDPAPDARRHERRRMLFNDLEDGMLTLQRQDLATEGNGRRLYDEQDPTGFSPVTTEDDDLFAPPSATPEPPRDHAPVSLMGWDENEEPEEDADLRIMTERIRPVCVSRPATVKEEAPTREAGKETAAPAPTGEEEHTLDYLRSITVQEEAPKAPAASTTGWSTAAPARPPVRPLPQEEDRAPSAWGDEGTYDDEDIDPEEEEGTEEPLSTCTAAENPYHPQNNPRYTDTGAERPGQVYDGAHNPIFTPDSALRDDLAGARHLTGQDAPTEEMGQTPPPAAAAPAARPAPAPRTATPPAPPKPKKRPYQSPPLSLLALPEVQDESGISAEVQGNAEKLLQTLDNFKVRTHIAGYSRGPRITRYEVVPEAGVRVRSISGLVEDISMSLATSGIRIEAPIPGKSAVGVEVPNATTSIVRLRAMLDTDKFRREADKTLVCVGGDVTGQPVYWRLSKMPHVLVAGATGMGKSVCINSIIVSLLYKASPEEVRLIMIDPKKVEFGMYSGIPHLLVPVVTDPKKAAGALSWAVNEMEHRFNLIEQSGVRDIDGYNRKMRETGEGDPLPKIIIIIDELHDLMMSAADMVETSIARIAAKARAAGIHLLIGTQRPSVDVITGTIKANIPSRIAFHVSSQIDSRTILDFTGAEKLLPHGDMLFAPVGIPKPMRVQGAFVDEKEIERIVEFLKENNDVDTEAGETIMADIEREAEKCDRTKKNAEEDMPAGGGENVPQDESSLLWAALDVGFNYGNGKLATSLLQRRLKLGYSKAARMLDELQDMGYISEKDGMKPRDILITREEFTELRARGVEASRANCTGDDYV